jgi:hypothetical protein
MPKSYKICLVTKFATDKFTEKPLFVNSQQSLDKIDRPPSTSIWKSRDEITFKDFQTYDIEHEREEEVFCRIGPREYNKIIRKGFIKAYHSENLGLLLLSGKKADILDFCKKTKDFNFIKIQTASIDMKKLLQKLAAVNLVWFRFRQGEIHASALMGSHVESTPEFHKYEEAGDISTLSFYFQILDGNLHPVMVTQDGAIVLYQTYQNISDEVEIVLNVKQELLDDICRLIEIK